MSPTVVSQIGIFHILLYIYFFLRTSFHICSTLSFNAIAVGHMRTVSKIFIQLDSQLA